MSTIGTARNACADPGAFHYQRHRSEKTLLYQLVSKHYPVFRQRYAATGRFPYYLIANTRVPLFRELKKTYNYKYVQGRPADRMKVGMSSYHIFDLRTKKK